MGCYFSAGYYRHLWNATDLFNQIKAGDNTVWVQVEIGRREKIKW